MLINTHKTLLWWELGHGPSCHLWPHVTTASLFMVKLNKRGHSSDSRVQPGPVVLMLGTCNTLPVHYLPSSNPNLDESTPVGEQEHIASPIVPPHLSWGFTCSTWPFSPWRGTEMSCLLYVKEHAPFAFLIGLLRILTFQPRSTVGFHHLDDSCEVWCLSQLMLVSVKICFPCCAAVSFTPLSLWATALAYGSHIAMIAYIFFFFSLFFSLYWK